MSDSKLRHDRMVKAGLYAFAKVPEYWLVDLIDGRVEVYRGPTTGAHFGWGYGRVEMVIRDGVLKLPESVGRVGEVVVVDVLP